MDLLNYSLISFDCYGTLVDWEKGILQALKPILEKYQEEKTKSEAKPVEKTTAEKETPKEDKKESKKDDKKDQKDAPAESKKEKEAAKKVEAPKPLSDDEILQMYARFEAEAEKGTFKSYREVQADIIKSFGKELGFTPTAKEAKALSDSLADWKPFSDTVKALRELKKLFRLAVISNADKSQIEATLKNLKVPFDFIVSSEEAKAYKPSLKSFEYAEGVFEVNRGEWLHVAQSLFHDVAPAKEFGLDTVWVNRNKNKNGATPESKAKPDHEVSTLKELAELV